MANRVIDPLEVMDPIAYAEFSTVAFFGLYFSGTIASSCIEVDLAYHCLSEDELCILMLIYAVLLL